MIQLLIPIIIGGYFIFKDRGNKGLKGEVSSSIIETKEKITFHYSSKNSEKEILEYLKNNTKTPKKEIHFKISKFIYSVHNGSDVWSDKVLLTLDKEKAYLEFEDLEREDPNSTQEYKGIDEAVGVLNFDNNFLKNEIEEDWSLLEVIEDIIENIDLKDFEDYEFKNLELDSFDRANDKSDDLLSEVEEILSKKFKKRISKYFDLKEYSIRLADHSPNPSRLGDVDISIVVSNHDETRKKFRASNKSTYFDSETPAQEIVDFILEQIS